MNWIEAIQPTIGCRGKRIVKQDYSFDIYAMTQLLIFNIIEAIYSTETFQFGVVVAHDVLFNKSSKFYDVLLTLALKNS